MKDDSGGRVLVALFLLLVLFTGRVVKLLLLVSQAIYEMVTKQKRR